MSIHLNIKTDNPEIEALLTFMRSQYPHADEGDLIVIMNDAINYLRTVDEYKFKAGAEVSLDFVHTAPESSVLPGTPVQSLVSS